MSKAMEKLTFNEELCKGCGLCIALCPKKILELDGSKVNQKGYNSARCVNVEDCISCAICAKICPDSVITVRKEG
ncbi:MAG: 4Fe-4S dicluster domain-containing protein [Defluviitaleaceae bacterium]|nr:4Fe-4S dicluster domain-containing protein [Defluviitaleaceae bacterium]